jgi:hypothetical protein
MTTAATSSPAGGCRFRCRSPAASAPLNTRAASPATPISPSRNRQRLHSDRCSWLPALSPIDRRITRASRPAVKSP